MSKSELRAARLRAQLAAGAKQKEDIDDAYALLLEYATDDGKPAASSNGRLLQALLALFLLPLIATSVVPFVALALPLLVFLPLAATMAVVPLLALPILVVSAAAGSIVKAAVTIVPTFGLLFLFYWFVVRDIDRGRNF